MNQMVKNLFGEFQRKDYVIWICSLIAVIISNLMSGSFDMLTLIAACLGVTSLIFATKGHVAAQVLMIVFSILYGVISYRFCYWGEMITYLGMTMPMAVWSLITWVKNPSEGNANEVAIHKMSGRQWGILLPVTLLVTWLFYLILAHLQTPNMLVSTLSVTTSFMAAALTMLRSSYFAFFYAMNDLVLIVLWILASMDNPAYIPVVVNFVIFFFNDMYGFINWKKRERALKS